MAVLVVLRWTPAGGGTDKYGDLDIIQVLDADQSPGTVVEANTPARFGFFYVHDKDVTDPGVVRFMEQHTTGTGDEISIVSHRKWGGVRANIPGDAMRLTVYHPWGGDGSTVPSNVKFSAANVLAFLRDKSVI